MSYISYTLKCKNSLEKAILEFLKENNRIIVEESKVEEFKEIIVSGIVKLNEENKRCKPVSFGFFGKHDMHLQGLHFVVFNLLEGEEN